MMRHLKMRVDIRCAEKLVTVLTYQRRVALFWIKFRIRYDAAADARARLRPSL